MADRAASPGVGDPADILVVMADDDEARRIVRVFTGLGVDENRVTVCGDGIEALELLFATGRHAARGLLPSA